MNLDEINSCVFVKLEDYSLEVWKAPFACRNSRLADIRSVGMWSNLQRLALKKEKVMNAKGLWGTDKTPRCDDYCVLTDWNQ